MVFVINVAADVYGRKENLRFDFTTRPTMQELINTTESQYDVAARSQRPAGYPDVPFRVQTFQIYDDILLRWVDLVNTQQLTNGSQVYAFQPDSLWTPDAQGTIPIPKDTITWTSGSDASPSRTRMPTDYGLPPTSSEKLRSVFADLDVGRKGYILYSDLRAALLRADIEFTYNTVGELFHRADANHDGYITYEEWVRFAVEFPNLVDALFFRQRDMYTAHRSYMSYSITDELIARRRARELELERMYLEADASRVRVRAEREISEARLDHDRALIQLETSARREQRAHELLRTSVPRY